MTDLAVDIRALNKTYAATKISAPKIALQSVDLAIPKGSIFGLLGPNGAGKSTLINIMAGLVNKTSGSVNIWGFDQDRNPRQSRAAIGVVPQELNVDPFFTPLQSLETQAGLYGVPKTQRRSREILEAVGLGAQTGSYARTLSGGMQRRLLLGKALVHDPQVLVLDEPTAGVDIELRQMLWDYVRRLNAVGKTIILTTHYLEEAEQMCDEIAIINHGEIIAQDSTKALVGSLDAKTLVVTPAQQVPDVLSPPVGTTLERREDGKLAFTYHRTQTSADQILQLIKDAEIEIQDITTEEPDLQDVFLALTSARRQ
ncbi:MAG: ABC transporter ATP-binding protein [Rhodobacteraceae bacterium]|nr:ABC transporter ATP-binding protein [Paracoccaceae bacterium]